MSIQLLLPQSELISESTLDTAVNILIHDRFFKDLEIGKQIPLKLHNLNKKKLNFKRKKSFNFSLISLLKDIDTSDFIYELIETNSHGRKKFGNMTVTSINNEEIGFDIELNFKRYSKALYDCLEKESPDGGQIVQCAGELVNQELIKSEIAYTLTGSFTIQLSDLKF